MREPRYLKLHRCLTIQVSGLITGGFLERLGIDDDEHSTPHDLPTRTVPVDGADLHYFEFGSGHPVVFVHGSFADYRAWFAQLQPFSGRARFITYSRRFHHPNAWSSDPAVCDTALHGNDLAQMLAALHLEPATLVGQSTGGLVALHTALHHPEQVHSLVLSEPLSLSLLCESPEGAELWGAYEEQYWRPAAMAFNRGETDAALAILCNSIMGPGTYEALTEEVRPILRENGPELRIEFNHPAYFSPFSSADAACISVPVLLVEGDRSPPMFGVIADALAQKLPNVTRKRFRDVCHVPPFFVPEAFNNAVFDFLDRVGWQ